jgi:hypothetical protein
MLTLEPNKNKNGSDSILYSKHGTESFYSKKLKWSHSVRPRSSIKHTLSSFNDIGYTRFFAGRQCFGIWLFRQQRCMIKTRTEREHNRAKTHFLSLKLLEVYYLHIISLFTLRTIYVREPYIICIFCGLLLVSISFCFLSQIKALIPFI